jgi:uncharacterized membrane protein YphA (DoxX/SURF4 family)
VDVQFLSAFCGSVVATALIASGLWKMLNHGEFVRALSGLPEPMRRVAATRGLVTAVELAAGVLILLPSWPGRLGAVAAAVLIVILALAARTNDGQACGCWIEPATTLDSRLQRRAFLLRNGVLLLAALGAARGHEHLWGSWLVAVPIGALAGLVVLEIPQIMAAATFVQSLESRPAR